VFQNDIVRETMRRREIRRKNRILKEGKEEEIEKIKK